MAGEERRFAWRFLHRLVWTRRRANPFEESDAASSRSRTVIYRSLIGYRNARG